MKIKPFTLVEFLVVVSVLLILFSLLNPTLKRTMVIANRAVCATHQKEMLKVSHIIAEDQAMMLPRGQRSQNGNDHTIWISRQAYNKYINYGLRENNMMCPNIHGERWGLKEGEVYKSNRWVLI